MKQLETTNVDCIGIESPEKRGLRKKQTWDHMKRERSLTRVTENSEMGSVCSLSKLIKQGGAWRGHNQRILFSHKLTFPTPLPSKRACFIITIWLTLQLRLHVFGVPHLLWHQKCIFQPHLYSSLYQCEIYFSFYKEWAMLILRLWPQLGSYCPKCHKRFFYSF